MYAWDLEWAAVSDLVARSRPVWTGVEKDLERFLSFLDDDAAAISSS